MQFRRRPPAATLATIPRPGDPEWLRLVVSLADSTGQPAVLAPPLPPLDEGYRALAAMTPDAVVVVDAALRIASVNDRCLALFGLPDRERMLGGSALMLLAESERVRAANLVARFLDTGVWDLAELEARHADGTPILIEARCEMLRDAEGGFVGLLALVRDLRDRPQGENPLRSIVEGTSRATGRAYLQSLVQNLAGIFEVKLAVVAELTGPDQDTARSIGFWSEGCLAENITYSLQGTPCEGVVAGKVCYYPEGIQDRFPNDTWLREEGVASYLGAPLIGSSGQVIGMLAVMDTAPLYRSRDVGSILNVFAARAATELERLRIEAALAESEERLAAAVSGSQDGLFDADLATLKIYCSPRLYAIAGFQDHEAELDLSMEGLLAHLHHGDAADTRAILLQCIAAGRPYHHTFRWRTRTGEYRWFEARLDTRCDASGTPIRLSGFITDITDLRREARLARETGNLTLIGGWELDLLSGQLYWTAGTFQLHGVTPATYAPTVASAIAFYAPESRPVITRLVERAMQTGEPWDEVLQVDPASGGRLWVRVLGQVEWDNSRPVRLLGAIQDISAQRRLEQALLQSQKLEGIGRLAGGIAHDFNNLLTAILGYAQLGLGALPPESPVREDLEQIRRAGVSAAELTSQLLAFARRQQVSPRAIALQSLLPDALPLLQRLAGGAVTVTLDAPPGVWPVTVDPGPVEQVLVNLVINARDAMPAGGTLTIAASNVGPADVPALLQPEVPAVEWVRLTIADTGSGIAADVLPLIFEPFFTTKERGQGTGLGLASCYGLIHQAGGFIWATSALGQGAAIHCLLPRSGQPAPDGTTDAQHSIRLGTEAILVVEDEPAIRALAGRVLRDMGYQVFEAATGAEALTLAKARAGTLDLVVSDVVMPQMSGPEVLHAMRAHQPGLKGLLISGYANLALAAGTSGGEQTPFLSKPFTPDALAAKVREVLDARPA